MPRWEPDSRERLGQAAVELVAERGYHETTAAEIAERAGLTERTFFRHFGDKREALFAREAAGREGLAAAVVGAPAGASPIEALALGLEAAAAGMQPRRRELRIHAALVEAHAELRERDLIKQARWAESLAEAFRQRGTDDEVAALTAEIGIAALRVAFDRWVARGEKRSLAEIQREVLDQLAGLYREG